MDKKNLHALHELLLVALSCNDNVVVIWSNCRNTLALN